MRSYSSMATPAGTSTSIATVAVVIGSSLNQQKVLAAAPKGYPIREPPFRPRLHLKTEEPHFESEWYAALLVPGKRDLVTDECPAPSQPGTTLPAIRLKDFTLSIE